MVMDISRLASATSFKQSSIFQLYKNKIVKVFKNKIVKVSLQIKKWRDDD